MYSLRRLSIHGVLGRKSVFPPTATATATTAASAATAAAAPPTAAAAAVEFHRGGEAPLHLLTPTPAATECPNNTAKYFSKFFFKILVVFRKITSLLQYIIGESLLLLQDVYCRGFLCQSRVLLILGMFSHVTRRSTIPARNPTLFRSSRQFSILCELLKAKKKERRHFCFSFMII